MKNKIIFILILLAFVACKKDEPTPITKVVLKDVTIKAAYTKCDILWAVETDATINEVVLEYASDSMFSDFQRMEMITEHTKQKEILCNASLSGLQNERTYYVRCLIVNKHSSYVTQSNSFTTLAYHIPNVRTDSASLITISSAQLNAELTDWGTDTLPQVGFMVSSQPNKSVADSCIICPLRRKSDSIIYYCPLTGLKDNTTYYVRAFAKNLKGISYGQEIPFTTIEILKPSIGNITISNISYVTATVESQVTSDGGAPVTERGFCYSKTPNPTISANKVINGSGIGEFTSNLAGLEDGTKYYVRAYATNSKGTAYGEEHFFTTTAYGTPTISTSTITNISYTSATCGGNVTADGGLTITERGVCYSTTTNPSIYDNKVTSSGTTGSFTCSLNGLIENTKYYVRAYATNNKGTAYGAVKTFTTTSYSKPTVTTSSITNISYTSATCGGNVTADGGLTIMERGVCYSTTTNPSIYDNKVTSSGTTGSFTCSLTGLIANTKYYVRAYATNSKGTIYGEEKSFTTTAYSMPTVTTSTVTNKSYTTATCGGSVTADGGLTITERGVCYSTSTSPTIYDNKVTSSGTTGSFTCSLTGLTANTKYYVRAYATNNKGTAYGAEKSFTTTSYSKPTVSTSTIINKSYTSATCGGSVTADGGLTITERGVCYSTSTNPTIYDNKVTSSGTTGSFTCSLTGLSEGTTYYVCAYATNSKGTSYGSDVAFVTLSHAGELPVNTTNLTGTWKCSYGNMVAYWVLKSGGTAYYIQDHSSYTSNGSYEKFTGTWTVNGSSFTFNQTYYYSYESGSLDGSGSLVDTDIVSVISLNSGSFTDASGDTWTRASLPSYIR